LDEEFLQEWEFTIDKKRGIAERDLNGEGNERFGKPRPGKSSDRE
jgi:hypothetical protein